MILREGGAVLLIVAGVLIGPIEPIATDHDTTIQEALETCWSLSHDTREDRGLPLWSPDCATQLFKRSAIFETTAETCDRTMESVGLSPVLVESRRGAKHRAWYGPDGNYAYCITAP